MTLRELISRKDIHLDAQLFVSDGNGNPVPVEYGRRSFADEDEIILHTSPALYQRNTRPKTQDEHEA